MKRLLLLAVVTVLTVPAVAPAASERAGGCSFLLKPIRDAQNAAAQQSLEIAWKSAKAAAVTSNGFYATPKKLLAEIKSSEPELTVKIGAKAQVNHYPANVVMIDPRSTKSKLILWTHTRSTTIWEAVATQTSTLQFIHAGGC